MLVLADDGKTVAGAGHVLRDGGGGKLHLDELNALTLGTLRAARLRWSG